MRCAKTCRATEPAEVDKQRGRQADGRRYKPFADTFFSEARAFPLFVKSYSIADRDQHTQTDAQTERQTDRQRDSQTERRTDRHWLCSSQLPRCSKAALFALQAVQRAAPSVFPGRGRAAPSLEAFPILCTLESQQKKTNQDSEFRYPNSIPNCLRRRVSENSPEYDSELTPTKGVGY